MESEIRNVANDLNGRDFGRSVGKEDLLHWIDKRMEMRKW